MKKEQSISSFHRHLISHKAKQWKEKLVPRVTGSGPSLATRLLHQWSPLEHREWGKKPGSPSTWKTLLKSCMWPTEETLGDSLLARVARISYQEVLREDDCVTWRFHCAIIKIRNVSLKASFQSS